MLNLMTESPNPCIVPLHPHLLRLNARSCVRRMRGQTGACLLEMLDGGTYVTKYQNNAFGPKVLISEWIGNLLMRQIGLPAPSFAAIEVPTTIYPTRLDNAPGTVPAGVHFGSQHPGDAAVPSIYDFLPERLMTSLPDMHLFAGVFVFDVWVANADLRQAVFRRYHMPATSRRRWNFLFIDNSHLFGGPDWGFVPTSLTGKGLWRLPYYKDVDNSQDFSPWLGRIEEIGEATLEAIVRSIPSEWLTTINRDELDYLREELLKRRRSLRDMVRAALPELYSLPCISRLTDPALKQLEMAGL